MPQGLLPRQETFWDTNSSRPLEQDFGCAEGRQMYCQKSVSSIKLARRVAPPMRHQLGAIPQFGTVQSIFASVTLFLPYIYPVIDSRTLARLLLVDVQSRFARPVRSARCRPRRALAALF